MRADIRYRWVNGWESSDEDWQRIEALLEVRGWASLNRKTTLIRIAEDSQGALVGFLVFQLIGFCGPLFVVPSQRGSGVAEDLTDAMFQFLGETHARGWIATAESAHAAQIMEKYGMCQLKTPTYVMPNPGGVEV